MSEVTQTPEFIILSKVLYLKIILDEINKDPNLWKTFSHEKQVEIHAIKKELAEHFKNKKKAYLKEALGKYGKVDDATLTKLVEDESY